MAHICPACGYAELDEPAWIEGVGASLEICPQCKIQFGYDDAGDDESRRAAIYRAWREAWEKSKS